MDFAATLPGYPPEYIKGLLKPPEIADDIFAQRGCPAYTWEETGDLVLDKPEAGKRWTAANPTSMYVSSLSWVAYPYGIPSDAKSCPYYKPTEESPPHHVMRGIPSENSSHYSEYTSSSTSSFSSSQSSASVESVQVPVPVDRTPEVAENFVSEKRKLFGWTGKNIQH